MAVRQNYYAESTGESTTTSATYQDKVTLNFTPDASSTYYYFFCTMFRQSTNTTTDSQVKFINTTTAVTFANPNVEPKDTSNYENHFSLGKEDFGASPAAQTLKLQYASEAGATVAVKESRIAAIKADAADQYGESLGTSTNATDVYVNKLTLTFTPATTGDYLIFATAEHKCNIAAAENKLRLTVDGVTYGESIRESKDATNWYTWSTMVKVSLSNASKDLKIDYLSVFTDTASIRNARILAIRLDTIDNNYYAESRGKSTTTSTSYQDKATLTQTPLNLEHIVFGAGMVGGSDSTENSFMQLIEGATSKGELTAEPTDGDAQQSFSYIQFYQATLAAASTTWKMQYKSEITTTTGISDAAIAILQTAATPISGTFVPRIIFM